MCSHVSVLKRVSAGSGLLDKLEFEPEHRPAGFDVLKILVVRSTVKPKEKSLKSRQSTGPNPED